MIPIARNIAPVTWLLVLLSATLQAGEMERLVHSTVDPRALTFADGPATRFGGTVNGRTHQQTPLTTYRGFQYATYFDANRRVCIARRKLPSEPWQVIRFTDHRFKSNDSHNTAVLGICDGDGTIHMAFDHHASRLNYRISKPGIAHDPESVRWEAGLFSGIRHKLGSVVPAKQVTYPRFFPAPNGNLMLYYRSVTSGNGDGMIEEYNGDKHDWMPGLGKFIARDIGSYTFQGKQSRYRCPYLNAISYAANRLHVSWVWRDRFEKTSVRNQHDLCYAYSDDHGRTWRNSLGDLIGATGKKFIHIGTPGLVVAPIASNSGLSNQNTHYAYPDGSLHVMLIHRAENGGRNVYHHHWRTADGRWKSSALSFSGTRPKLVGAKDRTLFLIYTLSDQVQIARGTPRPGLDGWNWEKIGPKVKHSCLGDALVDPERWEVDGVLSVYSQMRPPAINKTTNSEPVDGMPSALTVVDYQVSPQAP